MTRRCVVFDIDDTLYLERDYVRSGFAAVDAWIQTHLGLDGFAQAAWQLFEAGARGNIFDQALLACGHPPERDLIVTLVATYRSHVPRIDLLPDARACLEHLYPRVAIGVITDGPLLSQRAKATALGLARWATPIIFTEELGAGFGKPHRRAFELMSEAAAASGAACVYVADNPLKDFNAPVQLGWGTVRIRRKGGLHATLPCSERVDHEVEDLLQLAPILGL